MAVDPDADDQLKVLETQVEDLKLQLIASLTKLLDFYTKKTADGDPSQESEEVNRKLFSLKSALVDRVDVAIQTDPVSADDNACSTDYYSGYHAWSQYTATDYQEDHAVEQPTETRKVGDLGEDGMPVWDVPTTEGEEQPSGGLSIAEGLKAAATEVLQETGVVFDEGSGLYYDYSSGYYFDPERSLYYEPHSGTYYIYDHEKQEYKFHSQVDLTQYHSQVQQNAEREQEKKKRGSKKTTKRKEKGKEMDGQAKEHPKQGRRNMKKILYRMMRRKETLVQLEGKKDEASCRQREKIKKQQNYSMTVLNRICNDCDMEENRRLILEFLTEIDKYDTGKSSNDKGTKKGNFKGNSDKDSNVKGTKKGRTKSSTAIIHKEKQVDIFADDAEMTEMETNGTNTCIDPLLVDQEGEAEAELEEGELCESPTEDESDTQSSESEEFSEDGQEEEESSPLHYAPCIRAMVIQSDCLEVATLFIITCTGGTVGREQSPGHVITIPDINISKTHAGIEYREDLLKYTISDSGSQNGTFINGHRLSEAKKTSDSYPVSHRDVLTVGGTEIMLHIHPGVQTCDDCEPGQVKAVLQALQPNETGEVVMLTKSEKEQLRRQQLRQIKKKFGLENTSYIDDSEAINNPSYKDKAAERRRTKGSDNPYQPDDAPASVHRPIEESNKGHKMLAKMGWQEGKGLGAREQGLNEPVKAEIRPVSGAGLGSETVTLSLDNVGKSVTAARRAKVKDRYQKLTNTPISSPASTTKKSAPSSIWVKGETLDPS